MWNIIFGTFFIEAAVLVSYVSCKDEVQVTTKDCKIIGTTLKSYNNQSIFTFLAIPYAKPPIGELRFQPPQPNDNWSGVVNATENGKQCPQRYVNENETSENCLTLNVFSTNLDARNAVLVFVHGGSFEFGSSNSNVYGPKFLLDHNIVLVTMNFRLGPLGFLSLNIKQAAGNYGFKDQVMALKWIKLNIEAFGGNPNLVTLMGHSSGSMAVSLHLISPMSRDLFHRAILLSGSSTSSIHSRNAKWAIDTAQRVNCSNESSNEEILNCLKNKTWEDIYSTTLEDLTKIYLIPYLKWNYEIENDFGQERFLEKGVHKSYENGEFKKVPVMAGIIKDEFNLLSDLLVDHEVTMNTLDSNPQIIGEVLLGLEKNTDESIRINSEIHKFYLNNSFWLNEIKNETFEMKLERNALFPGFGNIFSDLIINHSVHKLVEYMRRHLDVFYFNINYSDYLDVNEEGCTDTNHLSYQKYLFSGRPCLCSSESNKSMIMTKKFTNLVASFVKNGNPNVGNNLDEIKCTTWHPSNRTNLTALRINLEDCEMTEELYKERYEFLDHLFKF